MFTNKEFAIET